MVIIGGWKLRYKNRKKKKGYDPKFKGYYKRNGRLSELGYASYSEYLASEDWKRIRDAKLSRHPNCLLCVKQANQVHHLDYSDEVLLGLFPQLLVTLCECCHKGIEFADEQKRSLLEANKELFKLAVEAGRQNWVNSIGHARSELKSYRKKARKASKEKWLQSIAKNKEARKQRREKKAAVSA